MLHAAVIDIGKTNAKVALVELAGLKEIAVHKMANRVLSGPPYPHYDTDGLWAFILGALARLQKEHAVDAVSITTHGASAALLSKDGSLAAPVLDYEFSGPDGLAKDYDAVRPDFMDSGSPRLPLGLNLGAQLFWQFSTFPELAQKVETILTYPQYWAYRLSGVARNEMTSLGCHTDLWLPREKRFSSLVETQGWRSLMAPIGKADECLGALLPEVAAQTGLSPNTPVYCGIHDSNASLYAHLVSRTPPFSVVSTGTWVISMAIGGDGRPLDAGRDTLINVDAFGNPVPSARFMGGREFEIAMAGAAGNVCSEDDIYRTIGSEVMLLPSIEPQSGPFQGWRNRWTGDDAALSPAERYAAVSFYLAMMTATGLDMIGADGTVLVEGAFAENTPYLRMLATAAGCPVEAVKGTGTSAGAALLARKNEERMASSPPSPALSGEDALMNYAQSWRSAVRQV